MSWVLPLQPIPNISPGNYILVFERNTFCGSSLIVYYIFYHMTNNSYLGCTGCCCDDSLIERQISELQIGHQLLYKTGVSKFNTYTIMQCYCFLSKYLYRRLIVCFKSETVWQEKKWTFGTQFGWFSQYTDHYIQGHGTVLYNCTAHTVQFYNVQYNRTAHTVQLYSTAPWLRPSCAGSPPWSGTGPPSCTRGFHSPFLLRS